MLKTSVVLLMGAMAVAGASKETFNVGPSVVYIKDVNYEAPLNCQASRAASDLSIGEEMCNKLRDAYKDPYAKASLSGKDQRTTVFECACALATHNIWYKGIADESMEQAIRLVDWVVVNTDGVLKGSPLAVAVNSFNDRVERLRSLKQSYWLESVEKNLGELLRYKERLNSFENVRKGREVAKNVCNKLANNEDWSDFIKPSLEAIESSSYGGARLRRALVMNQPELDQLVGFDNLCQNVMLDRDEE